MAVDFISVPVPPELLRAKVKVFAELYRKTWRLEELEQSLAKRAAAPACSEPQLHDLPVLTESRRAEPDEKARPSRRCWRRRQTAWS